MSRRISFASISPIKKRLDVQALGSRPATPLIVAFAAGGILAVQTQANGSLNHFTNVFFTAWIVHCLGALAAVVFLVIMPRRRRLRDRVPAPAWSYLGGIIGVLIVVMASDAVNSPLALSGTLALGLAGQVLFSLTGDKWGLFGLSRRRLTLRDLFALVLITSGCLILIFLGRGMS